VLTVSDSEHEGLMGVPDVPDVAERVAERGRHCCGRGNHSVAFRQRSESLTWAKGLEQWCDSCDD
jgi:hypothetical protein